MFCLDLTEASLMEGTSLCGTPHRAMWVNQLPWGTGGGQEGRKGQSSVALFPIHFFLEAVYAVFFNAVNKEATHCPPSTEIQ